MTAPPRRLVTGQPPPPGRRISRPYRRDIEGLRAVAVLAVVLYHAGFGWIPGGYVGVDVFYVISGFLITGVIWREASSDRSFSFGEFYARRARRLLPAAVLVLLVTVVAAAVILPPLDVKSVLRDGIYCALYVGNFRFAALRTDYLANASPSPLQHYWSLGVEEQFYLVWPVLLVLVSLLHLRRHSRPSRALPLGALGVISASSLALSIVLTRTDQPVAFFLLPARAWELGLGGIIALAAPECRRIAPDLAAVAGWAGLAAIVASCALFAAHTAFPGYAALLPVLGACFVVASGLAAPPHGPVLLLSRAPFRIFGRLSYSMYLWHYPVLILVPLALGHNLSSAGRLVLVGLATVLSVLTFRFVETPGRRLAWLTASAPRSLIGGLAVSAGGVAACLLTFAAVPSVQGHGEAPIALIRIPSPSTTAPAGPAMAATTTVPADVSTFDAEQAQVVAAVSSSAPATTVPADLDPSLDAASASEATPLVDGCLQSYTADALPRSCSFGDTSSNRLIILFGDSHAGMWFPAVDAYAKANGYRLDVWIKAACPPVDIELFSPALDRTWTECSDWYRSAMDEISAAHPTLVVLGIAPNYDAAYDVVQNGPDWQAGLTRTLSAVKQSGSRAVVIGSVPAPSTTVPSCLSAHLYSVTACDFSPVGQRVPGGGLVGIDTSGDAEEEATVQAAGATYADVRPWFCTTSTCDVIVDNLLVYRDNSHITVPYAEYLAPLISDEMTIALGSP